MNLFRRGTFTLHSGEESDWKIDCDALTDEDWKTLAMLISRKVGPFGVAIPVETGGNKLALALWGYKTEGPILLVDDVLTTGSSMEGQRRRFAPDANVKGAVVFARGPCPDWVTPLFIISLAHAHASPM